MSEREGDGNRHRRRIVGLVAGVLTATFGCLLWAGPPAGTPIRRPVIAARTTEPAAVAVSLSAVADPTTTPTPTVTGPPSLTATSVSVTPTPAVAPDTGPTPITGPTERAAVRRKP